MSKRGPKRAVKSVTDGVWTATGDGGKLEARVFWFLPIPVRGFSYWAIVSALPQ